MSPASILLQVMASAGSVPLYGVCSRSLQRLPRENRRTPAGGHRCNKTLPESREVRRGYFPIPQLPHDIPDPHGVRHTQAKIERLHQPGSR